MTYAPNVTHTAPSSLAYLTNRPALPMVAQLAIGFAVLVTKWSLRKRSRNHLAELSDSQLQDIGLTRAQARYEATLPFWRP